ncbi:LuxR C-terminal-related transcriptional regulator [Thalassolituus sp. LLYu03]|uniref:LuxR C-terminal-related transcriptional regulator n=1 Tax=Thalassolituus sp. LLYu03 TaxID=3421656 RepID=UPI003D2D77EB
MDDNRHRMSIIVESKLQPTFSELWIERPRLLQRLQTGNGLPTLLQAPAGYGKSALAATLVCSRTAPYCWLTLDALDNHVPVFWRYMLAALQSIDAQIGVTALNLLRHDTQGDPRHETQLVDLLLQDLHRFTRHRLRPASVTLVIDGLHFLTDSTILSGLDRFIDYSPDWLHLLLTSRGALPAGFARRLSHQQALLITGSELAFDDDEIRALYHRLDLPEPDDHERRLLLQTSSGWPAAVSLIVRPGKDHHALPPASPDVSRQHGLLGHYLQDELWQSLPDATRDLLLTMAIAGPYCPMRLLQQIHPMASDIDRALAPCSTLISIQQQQAQRCYQLNSLFAEWISDSALNVSASVVAARRQQILSFWTAAERFPEALGLALELHEWSQAIALLARCYERWIREGDVQALQQVLDRFPVHEQQQSALLSLIQAQIRFLRADQPAMSTALQAVRQRMDDAISVNPGAPWQTAGLANEQQWQSLEYARQLLSALAGLYHRTEPATASPTLSLRPGDEHPLADWWQHYRCVSLFLDDQVRDAVIVGEKAIRSARQQNNVYCLLATLPWLANARYQLGDLTLARKELAEQLSWLQQQGFRPAPAWTAVLGSSALLAMESGDHDQARQCFNNIAAQNPLWVEPREWLYNRYHLLAQWHMLLGHAEEADLTLDAADAFENTLSADARDSSVMPATSLFRLWFHLHNGNRFALLQWAQQEPERPSSSAVARYLHDLLLCAAHFMMGQDAEPDWQRLYQPACEEQLTLRQYGLLILKAAHQAQQGEDPQPLADQAFDIAHAAGYRLTVHSGYQLHGQWLLSWQSRRQTDWPGIPLTQARSATVPPPAAGNLSPPLQPLAKRPLDEPLTPREQEILQGLARGLSNREIASELDIAVSTVKRHIQNLYSKLNINRRTQAALLFQTLS